MKNAKHDIPEHIQYGTLLKDLTKEVRQLEVIFIKNNFKKLLIRIRTETCDLPNLMSPRWLPNNFKKIIVFALIFDDSRLFQCC